MKTRTTMWSLCTLAFTALMLLSACSKDKDKPVTEYDVYVAGYEDDRG